MNYDAVMNLALEHGFYFPSGGSYPDAQAGFWEYGPNGVGLKNKFLELWRRSILRRAAIMEIDGSQVLPPSVFDASGHLSNFSDPILECTKCHGTHRADTLLKGESNMHEGVEPSVIDEIVEKNNICCPGCKGKFGKSHKFNMMFELKIGPSRESAYLRPETCQSIFVDFARIFKTMRGKLPLGIAQVGKSFRNEIAPRQSLLRLREFYQAEIEIFCNPQKLDELESFNEIADVIIRIFDGTQTKKMTCLEAIKSGVVANRTIGYYIALLSEFYERTGIDMERTRFRKLDENEKAFYATTAFDFEVETSTGWLELVACNYRADYDLQSHAKKSGEKLEVIDGEDKVFPHIFEMSMGVDRSLYTILEHAFVEDTKNKRTVLSLKPYLAPVQVGVLSLVKKDGLEEKTNEVYASLREEFCAFLDHSGAIGRRYRRLDQIGAPLAITIDHQSLEDDTVTLRYRDSMEQERIPISGLVKTIASELHIGTVMKANKHTS